MGEDGRKSKGFEPLVVKEDFELSSSGSGSNNGVPSKLLKAKPIGDEEVGRGKHGDEEEDEENSGDTESSTASVEESDDSGQTGEQLDENEEEDDDEDEGDGSSECCPSASSESELSSPGRHGKEVVSALRNKDVKAEVAGGRKVDDVTTTEKSSLATASTKPLQKMPSFDFKNLKSAGGAGRSVIVTELATAANTTQVLKAMKASSGKSAAGLIEAALGSDANKAEMEKGIKKPVVVKTNKVGGKSLVGDQAEGTRGQSVSAVETKARSRSAVKVGLPPMMPTAGVSSEARAGGSGIVKDSSACPAWTCCDGKICKGAHQKDNMPLSVRSILSPLRQLGGDYESCSSKSAVKSSKGQTGRKRASGSSNNKRYYAASLPDQDCSSNAPFGIELNCLFEHQHGKNKLNKHGTHSFRGHPGPTKNCRSKHLWAQASVEREMVSMPSPSSPSNRHSSYHPSDIPLIGGGGGGGDPTAAAAAAAAAAYSHVLHNSRPSSPMYPNIDSHFAGDARSCVSEWDSCCAGCATKTFPRSSNRLQPVGCRCCHHHCDSRGNLGGSLLGLDYEDRLLRLESDKDTLHLQVSVLSDQIEAQTSKIQDLERLLDDKKITLETTEEQLQRELVTRSGLETQKLELVTEISGLRLKQATLERENLELKGRISTGSGRSLTDLHHHHHHLEGPHDSRIWDKPPLGPGTRGTSPAQTMADLGQRVRLTSDNFVLPPQQRVHTPPATVYRRVDQTASFGTLPRRNQPSSLSTFNSAGVVNHPVDSSNKCNSLSSGNINAISASAFTQSNGGGNESSKLAYYEDKSRQHQYYTDYGGGGGAMVVVGKRSSSVLSPRTDLPQMMIGPLALQEISVSAVRSRGGTGSIVGSKSSSVPDLAGGEDWQRRGNGNYNSSKSPSGGGSGGGGHKSRRILRILGKLRRSNSGGLENEVGPESHTEGNAGNGGGPNPFLRGGHRATAAPRLGWVREQTPIKMPEGPVSSWDSEAVVTWLNALGLGVYANDFKRWVKSGQQLLDATSQELEKELGIKNSLHKKKLNLALHYLKHPEEDDHAGKLDHHWVTRWLDDVGLPQYKEYFAEARIDGRLLSHLTADDLLSLKVVSVLHHASIKRGIQILRIHRFHPSCLCRRGSSAGIAPDSSIKDPKHVATWTNHRVMEWLKAVDLAEYAPNLRGSGVHGALMVFETRFNAELLATLLSIPGNKTLLRRHLSLQFNDLIGRHVVQEKRLAEIAPDFIPINPTVKVKPTKKTPFPLRKKRLSNEFSEELLCPLDLSVYPTEWKDQSKGIDADPAFGGSKVSNI